ncbi:Imm8 family immunity protein [Peribacillus sp. SCS-37]|uniref:Imm8 family immunity protein n=1 Tax=Paraperibacillus esterisolvens TaxID=3115296 RepID=UPI003905CA95
MLEIKDVYSSDINEVWKWVPRDPEEIYYLLEFNVGYVNDKASDIFYVFVATPEGLRKRKKTSSDWVTNKHLIVRDYSFDLVEAKINEILFKCTGPDWEKSVQNLLKYFDWEYDGREFV